MRRLEVEACHECPMRGEHPHAGPVCRGTHMAIELGAEVAANGPPPAWCPLRAGEVAVRLREPS